MRMERSGEMPSGFKRLLTIALSLPFLLCCATRSSSREPRDIAAFVRVNVVPMDLERVVTDQTVIARDGRIDDIGPASRIEIPEGTVLVDGVGKYLLPGVAEMPSVRQVNYSHLHHKRHMLPVSPSRRGSVAATNAKFCKIRLNIILFWYILKSPYRER
jgi:hypothetical protein